MNAALRRQVRQRARDRCEYCQLHQDHSPLAALQVEHITPRKHGGNDDLENLALACIDCNLAKSSNLSGLDPVTGLLTPLFHPRRDRWAEHFAWQDLEIVGLTAVGRTTVIVLNMNSADQLELRAAIADAGFPG